MVKKTDITPMPYKINPARITPKAQYQTSEDDRIPWKEEDHMATYFYNLDSLPPRSRDTSGDRCYGDADLDMLRANEPDPTDERSRKGSRY